MKADLVLERQLGRAVRRACPHLYSAAYNEGMVSRVKKPLLAPGNEAEWAKINEEEERQEAEFAAGLSMAERVAYGQKLSQQAVSLLVASVKAGHAPRRTLWS